MVLFKCVQMYKERGTFIQGPGAGASSRTLLNTPGRWADAGSFAPTCVVSDVIPPQPEIG